MLTWTDEQIAQWCSALGSHREDSIAKAEAAELRTLQGHVRRTILQRLTSPLEGQSTL